MSGQLFIGYPVIGTAEGRHLIDALLVSIDKGIVVFDLVEGSDLGDYASRQDDSANKLEARLKPYRDLVRRRDLLIPIYTISFAPGVVRLDEYVHGGYPIANGKDKLIRALKCFNWEDRDEDVYRYALSAIESVSTIRHSRAKRSIRREDSRGDKLRKLEASVATLDHMQSKAVVETVEGVQRIRGLAGSGKTIVLALKAAYLHSQHPEWRIAVTFNTRSLKGYFRRLINNFVLEQTNEEPDWNNLWVVNAWGGPGSVDRDGIYHQFCRFYGVEYLDFGSASKRFGRSRAFSEACKQAVIQAKGANPLYDVILVDESQDLPPAFLQICYELLDGHKRLVYAYDDLQNLSGESLPSPEEISGRMLMGPLKFLFKKQMLTARRVILF